MEVLPYRNLYVGMIETLENIFEKGEYSDKALERTFKQNKLWGSRDRAFVAEMVYDMVRWKYVIDFSSANALRKKHYWDFIGSWIVINDGRLPDLEEFKKLRPQKVKGNYLQAMKIPAIKHSVSDELFAIGENELGSRWIPELEAMNEPAPAVLRVNNLRTNERNLKSDFLDNEIRITKLKRFDDAYVLMEKENLFLTDEFKKGWFEMQDANSQLVAPFVDVEPGMRVADACAGAGGKSLHLADIMENKGNIVAMDIHQWKLNELKRRAKRAGAHNIQTKLIDSTKVLKRYHKSFDRVLIDAPCTGSGVLRRNPDAKYKIDKAILDRVLVEQKEILETYSKLLKPGGLLIYATCSIFPSENTSQVIHFLSHHPEFTLMEEKHLMPSDTGFDGFYMAKLKLEG